MAIYNEYMTKEMREGEIDYEKGYLAIERVFVAHHEEIKAREEVSHIETFTRPNGKTYEKKVIDSPAVEYRPAYDEYKSVLVYKLYTEKELAEREITKLKKKLTDTDYQAIKYAEGLISDYDYALIKQQRQEWRDKINYLETVVKGYV